MTIHFAEYNAPALCGAPVQKFRINVIATWGKTGDLFVNCPECLMHRPTKRKRREGFDRGKKFR
jgi:hypothetical protein